MSPCLQAVVAFALAAVAASPAGGAAPGDPPAGGPGIPFVADDLQIPAPGAQWILSTAVPGAAQIRASWVLRHDAKRASVVTLSSDHRPIPAELSAYVDHTFADLGKPPVSLKVSKKTPLVWKSHDAFRVEYSDRDGIRRFLQMDISAPDGAIVVLTLQAPDEQAFHEVLPAFEHALEKLSLAKGSSEGATRKQGR